MEKRKAHNQVRIIAGTWRGRKITFLDEQGLRPTTDRTRETLFNWLMHDIRNATCLDLFAGSGALGFEALSRGAKHVVMIDASSTAISQLKKNAQLLQTDKVTFYCAQLPQAFPQFSQPFDLVFLDPPFHQNLISPMSELLESKKILRDGALIYIEVEATPLPLVLPKNWKIIKSSLAGNVKFFLAERTAEI